MVISKPEIKSSGTEAAIIFVSPDSAVNGWLDRKLLRQTLVNLLTNSIKYSPQASLIDFELSTQTGQVISR